MSNGHVMISYNHEHQELMLKVKDTLESAGYKVWMDIDKMHGSINERMAEAVEGAEVILFAMSRKYQESDNCTKEYEYADKLKKDIIPLKVEKGFDPSGSLGFIVGKKLFYDLTKGNFDDKMNQLIRELGDRGKNCPWNSLEVICSEEEKIKPKPNLFTLVITIATGILITKIHKITGTN